MLLEVFTLTNIDVTLKGTQYRFTQLWSPTTGKKKKERSYFFKVERKRKPDARPF